MSELNMLGWREWVSFPGLNIERIKAKVDTGARTSCLHAFKVEVFEKQGSLWVSFDIHPNQTNNMEVIRCEAPLKERRLVRDSGGHEELRCVIETEIKIGNENHTIEVTLTDRDTMKFRVLLGRTAIKGHYLVDSGSSYLQGKKKRKNRSGELSR